MPSQNLKHVHKLKKHKYKSGNMTYFCTLPDCNYKVQPALALGKKSICNRCGNEFILNEYSIRLVKPHCENCHNSKDKSKVVHISGDNKLVLYPLNLLDQPTELPDNANKVTNSLAERLKKITVDADKRDEEI